MPQYKLEYDHGKKIKQFLANVDIFPTDVESDGQGNWIISFDEPLTDEQKMMVEECTKDSCYVLVDIQP